MTIGTQDTSFTVDGQKVTYAGLSCFRLLERQLRAQESGTPFDLDGLLASYDAVMDETLSFPFLRVLRVFSMYQGGIGRLVPAEHRDYFTTVAFLSDYVHEHSRSKFVIQWECLADCAARSDGSGGIMPNVGDRQRHIEQMAAAITGRPALGSLGNEAPKNGWSWNEHARPSGGNLWSKGSSLGDSDPPLPPWDFSLYHGRRDGVKCFLSGSDLAWAVWGHEAESTGRRLLSLLDDEDPFIEAGGHAFWPGTHGPTVMDEPIGFAEKSKPNSRASNPQVAYNIAFASRTAGSGATFHSDLGVDARPFSDAEPVQRTGALAHMMALSKADPAQSWNGLV